MSRTDFANEFALTVIPSVIKERQSAARGQIGQTVTGEAPRPRFTPQRSVRGTFLVIQLATISVLLTSVLISPAIALAHYINLDGPNDRDHDGLMDSNEAEYGVNPDVADTDGDGYLDGDEVSHGYDPRVPGPAGRLPKQIDIDLSEQRLRYSYGKYGEQGSFLISSGRKRTPTKKGVFAIRRKVPKVNWRGRGYYYPNAKWAMEFFPRFWIHGAYWHNKFGRPMSHGCINVSYKNMEKLYAWAEVGTKVIVHD